MDNLELKRLEKLVIDELDLDYDVDPRSIDELITIALSLPTVPPPPLKPNQTLGTEKISIRIPRYMLDWFRDEAKRRGMGYQSLMILALNESLKGGRS